MGGSRPSAGLAIVSVLVGVAPLAHAQLREADCPTPAELPLGRAYAILIGSPGAPAELGLPALRSVSQDVIRMHELLSILAPRATFVLARLDEVERRLHPELAPLPPTPANLRAAVEAIAADIEASPASADVYLYYTGHGHRSLQDGVARTHLFLEPDPAATEEPARSGVVDGRVLSELAFARLGVLPDTKVHVVVDACQSYFLLETRGLGPARRVPKRIPEEPALEHQFIAAHPRLGAILATNGGQATFERPDLGGLFSFAVRSAALGLGDLDGDGSISYGEMGYVIRQVLAGQAGGGQPAVVGVGGDDRAPFIDYRRARAARICFTPDHHARHELFNRDYVPYAVVHPPKMRPMQLYLPVGQPIAVMSRASSLSPPTWRRFPAANSYFHDIPLIADSEAPRPRGALPFLNGELMPLPLYDRDPGLEEPRPRPAENGATAGWYLGLGAAATASGHPGGGPAGMDLLSGAELRARLGRGAWQAVAELSFASGGGQLVSSDVTFDARAWGAGIAFSMVPYAATVELALGGGLRAELIDKSDSDGEEQSAAAFSTLGRADVLFPVAPDHPIAVAASFSAGVRWLCVDGCGVTRLDSLIRASLGFEWEVSF